MKASVEQIKDLIQKEVNKKLDASKLKTDISLNDQGVDSLEIAGLFLAIEETFDIEVSDEQIDKLTTIDLIVDFLNK